MAFTDQRRLKRLQDVDETWLNELLRNVYEAAGQNTGQTERLLRVALKASSLAYLDGPVLDPGVGYVGLAKKLPRTGYWLCRWEGRIKATVAAAGSALDIGPIAVDANGSRIVGARTRWTVPDDISADFYKAVRAAAVIRVDALPCQVGADAADPGSMAGVLVARYLRPL